MTGAPLPVAVPPDGRHESHEEDGGRTIVLFADGTGNAFAKQESNVWRLYDALDTSRSDQIALYVPGVGTSGFRPWALIDGATGLGVPANVRCLYEFLCWNYRPTDRIYMFGFSRGAFTIRALIGMIDSEGILSKEGVRGTASRPEMRRNVMSAWRAYRSKRHRSVFHQAPTIIITRWLRDFLLFLRNLLPGYQSYKDVTGRANHKARIRFAGLFDTVEAYGVPLEEMRDAIDWAVWPIRFHNRSLSGKVDKARHALSLDDERQTFHPVRFAQDPERDTKTGRIEEVWFAGVHSDVGGGYPDDANAFVALNWMLGQLEDKLHFKSGACDAFKNSASALDATHDSRAGLATFYRYSPRVIGSTPADGGSPIIHHSVIDKMVSGPSLYAPHALPADVRVLMSDGRYATIDQQFRRPDEAYVAAVNFGVWLRRKAYFLLLAGVLACASLPWTAALVGFSDATSQAVDSQSIISEPSGVLQAWGEDIASVVSPFIPGYGQPWAQAIVAWPMLSLPLLAATVFLYVVNNILRDKINDDARCAWIGSGAKKDVSPKWSPYYWLANRLRKRVPRIRKRGFFYGFWYAVTVASLVIGTLLYLDRVWLSYRVGAGQLCTSNERQEVRQVKFGTPVRSEGFEASNPCWDTRLFLEKGAAYEITLEMVRPFMDRSIVADVGGFTDSSWRHWIAAPLRRWFTASYFQPVARIGAKGMTEFLLTPVSGEKPRHLGSEAEIKSAMSADLCAPVQADAAAVAKVQTEHQTRQTLVSRFVAPKSGQLYMYLNDAIFGSDLFAKIAWVGAYDCFYQNNNGEATITVKLLGTDTK